jgi:hypothetical protein
MNTKQLRALAILWIAAALLGPAVFAQQPANGIPVHMVVTVEPRHEADSVTVTRDDVMVFEGKERDRVAEWVPAQGDRAGLELFILLDNASSTSFGLHIPEVKKFISEQPATSKVGVAYMQNGVARIEQSPTADHELAAKAIHLPQGIAGANASPYFALSDLAKHWLQTGDRHEVLIVSDGIDFYYGTGDLQDPYLSAAIDDCQRAGILVSAIYFPGAGHLGHSYWLNYWGQMYLARLAEETGGESYGVGLTGSLPDLTPYLTDAARRLDHQYLLTFLAKPEKKPGLRSVKLRTELHNIDLVSANAVYVPASE